MTTVPAIFDLMTDGRWQQLAALREDRPSLAGARANMLRAIGRLTEKERRQLHKRMPSATESETEAFYFHLLVYEYLARSGTSPQFEPEVAAALTPDLVFTVEGTRFVGDVYVTHSPAKAEQPLFEGSDVMGWVDTSEPGISRAKKIGDTLANKATKYAKLAEPLVLFVICGDTHALDEQSVEQALFGMTVGEVDDNGVLAHLPNCSVVPSAILVPDYGGAEHDNLSAVVAVDHFWSVKRGPNGKGSAGERLAVRVLENPHARTPFPRLALKGSHVIFWPEGLIGPPEQNADALVIAFASEDELCVAQYTQEDPW